MSQTQSIQPQTVQQEPALLPGTDDRFSGKYNGLVLYFSRIVRYSLLKIFDYIHPITVFEFNSQN